MEYCLFLKRVFVILEEETNSAIINLSKSLSFLSTKTVADLEDEPSVRYAIGQYLADKIIPRISNAQQSTAD